MKRLLLITLGFASLISCKKDKEPAAPPKTIIGKHEFTHFASEAIMTTDGNIVILGQTNYGEKYFLAKYSVYGEQLWMKTYEKGDIIDARGIEECPGEGYMIISEGEFMGTKLDQIFVTKVNTSGDILWKKDYGTNESEAPSKIIRTYDNQFMIAGYTSLPAANNDIYLLKIDKDGNQKFAKTVAKPEGQSARDLIETADHNYVIAGTTINPASVIDHHLYILKVSENGDKLWDNQQIEPSGSLNGRGIIELPDGSFALCGEKVSTTYDSQAFIAKTSAFGTFMWKKEFGEADKGEIAYDIVSDGNDGFMIAGRLQRTDIGNGSSSNIYYLGANAAGEEQWKHNVESTKQDVVIKCFRLSGGEYILIGNNYLSSSIDSKHYIIGISANGEM